MPYCKLFNMHFLECSGDCEKCGRVREKSHTHSILEKSGTKRGMTSPQFRKLWEDKK